MRGGASDLAVTSGEIAMTPEKQQEQELMGRLAANGKLPARPASSFLQKKLQQRKFFDSGDYAMDKSKAGTGISPKPHPLASVPAEKEQVSPQPVTSPSPSASPVSSQTNNRASSERSDDDSLQIPRPDTVPQRKASIINPSVHCKLSPAPHVHHHDSTASSVEEKPEKVID